MPGAAVYYTLYECITATSNDSRGNLVLIAVLETPVDPARDEWIIARINVLNSDE